MIEISLQSVSWLNTPNDSPEDKCAHGRVRFSVNGAVLVHPTDEWTVSAAAIYLLRTLQSDHTDAHPLCEHLFPCCGHTMIDDGNEDVAILGCCNGVNLAIQRTNDSVTISNAEGNCFSVPYDEYAEAVRHFSSAVRAFYDKSCLLYTSPSPRDRG